MTTKCWNCGRPLNTLRGAEQDPWSYCARPEETECRAVCAALAQQSRQTAEALLSAARWAGRVKLIEARAAAAAMILRGEG